MPALNGRAFMLSTNWLLMKPHSEIYRKHRRKHFPYRQGINIFVSTSLQLHWHWPFKKTPLTWDICTNMRTCSVKRPCIDRIYNVQVVLRVQPTPRRGGGVSKERGSQEGENLRDRERGCQVQRSFSGVHEPCVSEAQTCTWSLWLSPSFILTSALIRIANPRSAVRQKELSVACYHSQSWMI